MAPMQRTGPRTWLRRSFPVLSLIAIVTLVVVFGALGGGDQLQVTLREMLIRMVVVIGMYVFIGNSGILSFGHIGFMCIGAYAAAWATVDPNWKQMMLTGLPAFLQQHEYPLPVALAGAGALAGLVALLLGAAIMRLSGIAGSIATFAFLAIVNSVYGNWETVTAGASSIVGVPDLVGIWTAWAFTVLALLVAFAFQTSNFGLMLRASRDDETAAKSSAVNIVRVRLIGFVLSAIVVGVAGGLYGHFLGILTVDIFYLPLSFLTLAMLVVGGVGSLAGAVIGVLTVTAVVELLRFFEAGTMVGGIALKLPEASSEIGLALVLVLIMIFRPTGLMRGREFIWRRRAAATTNRRAASASLTAERPAP